MLLLARLRRIIGEDEVHEVLVGDEAVGRVATGLPQRDLELLPVAGDVRRRRGWSRDPAVGLDGPGLDGRDEAGDVR